MSYVRDAVRTRKVNLLSLDRNSSNSSTIYELPVDGQLKEFTVSLSGESPSINITDPDGEPCDVKSPSIIFIFVASVLYSFERPEANPDSNLHHDFIKFIRVTYMSDDVAYK